MVTLISVCAYSYR